MAFFAIKRFARKRFVFLLGSLLALSIAGVVGAALLVPETLASATQFLTKQSPIIADTSATATQLGNRSKVLGASTVPSKLQFNLPATFTEIVNAAALAVDGNTVLGGNLETGGIAHFAKSVVIDGKVTLKSDVTGQNINIDLKTGKIIASNVVYSVTAGSGVSVTGDQDLVVENTDKGSDQKNFKTIKVGNSSFDAGSNSDTLTLVGSGVDISTDTANKKITFTVAGSNTNLSGFTDENGVVHLTTIGDSVGIGTNSPTAKLDVAGTTRLAGDVTITQALQLFGGMNNQGGGITNAGSITGGTGLTSSGTITFSGLSLGIVHSSLAGVLSSSALNIASGSADITGVLSGINGGTGLSSYTLGDMLYATGASILGKLGIGANGQVLTVASGIPTWGAVSAGAGPCTNCILSNPGSTQSITATSSGAISLSVRQPVGGSVDIFNVASNDGSTKYFRVDLNGNVIFGSGGLSSSSIFTVNPANTDPISISPHAQGSGAFTGTITSEDLLAARTWTLPDADGTICLTTGNCNGVGGNFGGSGTTNYLAKFNGSSTVANSLLYDNGVGVGIGTTNPLYALQVMGNGFFGGNTVIGGSLDASGAAQLASTLRVTGASNFLSTLDVTGATTLSSTLGVTGGATLSGTLAVVGNAAFDTNTLYVNAITHNVGIGTTNPTQKMYISGSGTTRLYIADSSSTAVMRIVASGVDGFIGSDTGDVYLQSGATNRLRLTQAGNFRFGDAVTPTNMFEFNGGNLALGNGKLSVNPRGAVVTPTEAFEVIGNGVFGTNNTTSTFVKLNAAASNKTYIRSFRNNSERWNINFGATDTFDLTYVPGSITPLSILSNGNVGIGTTNPTAYNLQVGGSIGGTSLYQNGSQVCDLSGNCNATGNFWQFSNGALSPSNPYSGFADLLLGGTSTASAKFALMNVGAGTPTASISGNLAIAVPTGATPATTYNILNGGSFSLQTSPGGNAGLSSRLFVANNGNVGIGVTNPGSLLEVGGKGQFGLAAATVPQLVINGGSGGNDIIQLVRTSGATLTYGWNLGGGRLSFTDRTSNITTLQTYSQSSVLPVITIGSMGAAGSNAPGMNSRLTAGESSPDGTNLTGGILTLQSGRGTGIGATPSITFQTPDLGVSGATQQTLSAKMTIMGSGNVGIGTASPTSLLAVGAASQFSIDSSGNLISSTITTGGIDGSNIDAAGTLAAGTGNAFQVDSSGNITSSGTTGITFSGANAGLSFSSSTGPHQITTGGSTNLAFMPGGNVGIGTTNPSTYKLEVAGSIGGTSIYQNGSQVCDSSGNCSGSSAGVGGSGTTNYLAKFNGTYSLASSVLYDNGTNLGIGTTSPAYNLDVSTGTVRATRFFSPNGIKVDSGGYATTQIGASTGNWIGTAPTVQMSTVAMQSTSGNQQAVLINPSLTPASGSTNFVGLQVNPTINGVSSGTATALAIASKTNTLTGGTINLFDVGTTSTDYFTGYSSKFLISSTGNVGIGTTTPAGLLDISKAISAIPSSTIGNYLSLTGSTLTDSGTAASGTAAGATFNSIGQSTLAATNASVTTTNAYGLYLAGAPVKGTNESITNTTALNIAAGAVGAVTNSYGLQVNAQTGGTNNYAAIFSGGNVGIGTTSPTTKLNVLGSATVNSQAVSADFEKAIYISNPSLVGDFLVPMFLKDSGGTARQLIGISNDAVPNTLLNIPSSAGSKFIFTKGGILSNSLVTILGDSGSVGIGTTSPVAKLHSYGTAEQLRLGYDASNYASFTTSSAGNLGLTLTGTTPGMNITAANTTGTSLAGTFNSLTTGTGFGLNFNGLSTGKGIDLQSTSTALSTGGFFNGYWNPGSATTATGDLFKLDLGANATLTGNILALYNNGSSIFRVSTSQINNDVPTAFNAAGDVSMANDLVFTNQTASNITSYGPLNISSGENFENNDLTLTTYGTGKVNIVGAGLAIDTGKKLVFDSSDGGDTVASHSATSHWLSFSTDGTEAIRIKSNGSVDGHGSFNASNFDLAEYYPTEDSSIAGGDVVAMVQSSADDKAVTSSYLVAKTTSSNTQQVLGVVSTKPGYTMGTGSFRSEFCSAVDQDGGVAKARETLLRDELKDIVSQKSAGDTTTSSDPTTENAQITKKVNDLYLNYLNGDHTVITDSVNNAVQDKIMSCKAVSSVPIALSGRVPVKVDAKYGEIKAGDLLMASAQAPGKAVKATQSGWVIGRALEDHKDGTDTVMTYVFTSYYDGSGITQNNSVTPVAVDLTTATKAEVAAVDITATSTLSVGNLLIAAQDSSITTSEGAPLKLQTGPDVGDIDLFNGKLVIDIHGAIISKSDITARTVGAQNFKVIGTQDEYGKDTSSVGTGVIKAGAKTIVIANKNVTISSKIFLTPRTSTGGQGLVVTSVDDKSFTVSIDQSVQSDITFDYWILGVQLPK